MRTYLSELASLAALLGGVDEAAEALSIDVDLYQTALDREDLNRVAEAIIDTGFAQYMDTADEQTREQIQLGDSLFFNLTDGQIDKILDNVTIGGGDFSAALSAFAMDGEDISDTEDSEFWAWFREFYE